ncbi:subtype B tannase [Acinetobacter populi]|uniref:Alpha/beta hydrolase n=1 Tax=Acinetobacter populi TaxID=1582270 RepID=A0A1Z9YUT3_9GAMM|nr:subtype B tannase [Acinetobacter populi]OUY05967.1 alpha/beta hydrolase [Acinetobacter populi]
MTHAKKSLLMLSLLGSGLFTGCNTTSLQQSSNLSSSTVSKYSLDFNPQNYSVQSVEVDGKKIAVRAYENIVYVANPVDTDYQIMNIYIPEDYFHDKSIGAYNAATAPIFFPNQVGGYMPGKPATLNGRGGMGGGMPPMSSRDNTAGQTNTQTNRSGSQTNSVATALSRGYIVASAGARGRTTQNAQGIYTGKAPAAIVDLKAAVSYLHFNDARMPGDANKIISNGTSAGGALSALLGATGDHPEYRPYLTALGAAPASNAIFAVSAYCPISNLDHADSAYEWQFKGINTYKNIKMSMLDYNVQRQTSDGTLTSDQIQYSQLLAQTFPAYLNGLKLHDTHQQLLQLDTQGEGSFKNYVKQFVINSAQKALAQGTDLSVFSWLTVKDGKVVDLDFDQYLHYLGRMKTPGAFDGRDLSTGENQLFGTEKIDKQHFTDFAQTHNNAANATQADAQIVKLMNPNPYIGLAQSNTASHWRIRHGSKDSDTSLAIPVILATLLENKGYDVDFALAWDKPHSGDYDLTELFSWMDQISQQTSKK